MVLYIALLICLIAIIMLVFNWRVNRNTVYLSLLILFLSSYTITAYILTHSQSRFWIALSYAHTAPLWYLPGPLLYFYTRGILKDDAKLQKQDLLHLIPFSISLIGLLPYLVSTFDEKLKFADEIIRNLHAPKYLKTNWILSFEANLVLRPTIMICYALVSIAMVWKAKKTYSFSPSVPQSQWLFIQKWLLLITTTLIIASIPSLLLSVYYSTDSTLTASNIRESIYFNLVTVTQLILMVVLMIFPQILYGLPLLSTQNKKYLVFKTKKESRTGQVSNIEPPLNYAQNTRLEADPFFVLGERVLQVMKEKQPYLNPDFTLDDLADLLDVPKHHLYYCFQNVLHTKFTRLRTEFRVEHAKKLLAEADFRRYTFDSIGREAGFASVSSFYQTFKNEVGCTPGAYAAAHNKTGSYQGE